MEISLVVVLIGFASLLYADRPVSIATDTKLRVHFFYYCGIFFYIHVRVEKIKKKKKNIKKKRKKKNKKKKKKFKNKIKK